MNENIIRAIEDAAYECGTIGLDVRKFAFENGYYSYEEVIDADGNLVDCNKVLTRKDLQEVADIFCDNFDAINY